MINPSKPLLNDTGKATIISPDGSVANMPSENFTLEEVKLLREYKKFLLQRGYREALYCTRCFENNLQDGVRAYVTATDLMFQCRCRCLFHKGSLY